MASSHELDCSRQSIMRVNPQRASTERKNRKALNCDPCRRRKVKCDRFSPCNQCLRHKTPESCHYATRAPNRAAGTNAARASQYDRRSTPEVENAPPRQRSVSGSETACISDHGGQHEALYSPRSPHCTRTATVGLDPTIQSLGRSSFPGSGDRTRFFGRSHWALTVDMFPDLRDHLRKYHEVKQSNTHAEFSEYLSMRQSKQVLRQDAMYRTYIQPSAQPPDLCTLIPNRQLTDQLVTLYFSTFETTFRILHRVRFIEEYDKFYQLRGDTRSPNTFHTEIFAAKTLALISCASCFLGNQFSEEWSQMPDKTAKEWIQAVVSWVKLLPNSARLNLDIFQIECLLLLAQQAVGHEGDFSWSASGSLVRNGIMIGLHRDPSNYKDMSPYWKEIRRRLWTTAVELDLQAALSLGAPTSISDHEYDCQPPSNVDDEDLQSDAPSLPPPQPRRNSTGTSFLTILAETFKTRARIARLINSVRLTENYSEVLELSETLTNHISSLPTALRNGGDTENSRFRTTLLLFLIYRSLLALHRPYFLSLSETGNKMYSYSQKIYVQISQAMLSPLAPFLRNRQSEDRTTSDHYYLHLKGGMFRDELFHAAATLCFEIRRQSQETLILPLLGTETGNGGQYMQNNSESLFQMIEHCLEYFEMKVRNGKQASKSFMLLHMFYASAKNSASLQTSSHQASNQLNDDYYTLEKACPRAAKRCKELLLDGIRKPSSEDEGSSEQVGWNADSNFVNTFSYPQQPAPDSLSLDGVQPFQPDELGPEFYDLAMEWNAVEDPFNVFPGGDFWPIEDPVI